MNLIDQLVMGAIKILDGRERRSGGVLEPTRGVKVGSRQQDHLGPCAVGADGVHGVLEAGGPSVDVEVVRLVHEAEDDVALRGVALSELGPQVAELLVRWPALGDDTAVPAGVVVDVENAFSASGNACLHELVVSAEEGLVEWAAEVVVEEILPADGEAEDVKMVVAGEMLHLRRADCCWAVGSCGIALILLFSILRDIGYNKRIALRSRQVQSHIQQY